ncbi:DUF4190 domain-containing protein [Streptomyces sp. NPDC046977]|uniref:DUF4190 domain-containing protein n=1 Tax=Streptomyces sp. NPDC046977 TaxID=3154703 RepID=UPI0033FF4AC4
MDSPYSPQPSALVPPARRPLNKLAVAALVLGLVCVVPVVGIVLGAVALTQIDRRGERGKGLAVAGLVLSTLSTLVAALIAIGGLAAFTKGFSDGLAQGARNGDTLSSLRRGDCFDTPKNEVEGAVRNAATVPCARVHTGEVFGVFQMSGENSGFPGDHSVTTMAEKRCGQLQNTYTLDTWALPKDAGVSYFVPTSRSWKIDERQVICFYRKDSGPLTGSLRRDETTLDAHQLAYLKAVNTLDDAKDDAPEAEYIEDDLKGYKQWAQDVTIALGQEARLLRHHDWPAAAQPHVAALAKETDAARAHWAKAAGAKNAHTYYDHYKAGERLSGHDEAVKARAALGLARTDPAAGS